MSTPQPGFPRHQRPHTHAEREGKASPGLKGIPASEEAGGRRGPGGGKHRNSFRKTFLAGPEPPCGLGSRRGAHFRAKFALKPEMLPPSGL